MTAVGIRTLKNRLSFYLRRVQAGRTIHVAHRGQVIAMIVPIPQDPEEEAIWKLVRAGVASWSGGKPRGASRPVKIHGPSVAQAVLEDRR
jgi:antitoxin (DNA-binding transcriptional repressor) of toxin-antitoxin stability system